MAMSQLAPKHQSTPSIGHLPFSYSHHPPRARVHQPRPLHVGQGLRAAGAGQTSDGNPAMPRPRLPAAPETHPLQVVPVAPLDAASRAAVPAARSDEELLSREWGNATRCEPDPDPPFARTLVLLFAAAAGRRLRRRV